MADRFLNDKGIWTEISTDQGITEIPTATQEDIDASYTEYIEPNLKKIIDLKHGIKEYPITVSIDSESVIKINPTNYYLYTVGNIGYMTINFTTTSTFSSGDRLYLHIKGFNDCEQILGGVVTSGYMTGWIPSRSSLDVYATLFHNVGNNYSSSLFCMFMFK